MGKTSGDPNDPVRGHVWKRHNAWHMAVFVGQVQVAYDNTGYFEPMFRECQAVIPGIARLVRSGVRLPKYGGNGDG